MEMSIFSLTQHPTIGRVFERHPHARGAGFADDLALLTSLKVSELRQRLGEDTNLLMNVRFMVTGGTRAAAGGPRQSAETGNARAETLGPDGGQQTWKPGPGVAEEGPTDAKESPHILFPLSMPTPGEGAGAGGGGPRGMGAAVGRPGAGARHAARPAPGTAAGEEQAKKTATAITHTIIRNLFVSSG